MRFFPSIPAFLALLAAVLLPLSSSPAKEADYKTETERIVTEAVTGHRIPSLVVAIIQNGKVEFQKAYGKDPLYTFAVNATSNTYALGPVSEVLTGAAILELQEKGKLSLDDSVGKYLPDVPEEWRLITLKQFLTHQSGVQELPRDSQSFAAAVAAASKQPMRFRPGAAQSNNPADYDVLGQVIVKVTGQDYNSFMQRNLFKEMKFTATGDYSLLLFRFVAPQDFNPVGPQANTGNTDGNDSASGLSGQRGFAGINFAERTNLIERLQRGIPGYSVPSRGLVSNVQDIARIANATFTPAGMKGFSNPDYIGMAPGWHSCNTGKDVLLTDAGFGGAGYGINLSVLPSRKTALVLLWKAVKSSDPTNLHDESQEILESALGIPVSTWVCTGTDEENDVPDDDTTQQ